MAIAAAQMAEMFERLITGLRAAPSATEREGHDGPREERGAKKQLDVKGFSRVDKFAGGEAGWKEWSFDFKVAVMAQSNKVHQLMEMEVLTLATKAGG